jgi:DNA-binding transcriptional MerR regulator
MKNATLRRNGQKMFTIRVEHHIGIDKIATILGAEFFDIPRSEEDKEDEDELEDIDKQIIELNNVSRKEIEQKIREILEQRGSDYFIGAWDYINKNDSKRLWEACFERVKILFPELLIE